MMKIKKIEKLTKILDKIPGIEAYSLRILIGGMLSNYLETTNIKVAAIKPGMESKVIPLLPGRIKSGEFLKKGGILIPDLVARGFNAEVGQDIVFIANNKDGSVNGQTLKITGIIETVAGPSGKYGYIHFDDAIKILRMDQVEVSEVAVRLKNIDDLDMVVKKISRYLEKIPNKKGKPYFEVHSWKKLSPFFNIARMIDLMSLFIRIILIAVVLISVMNVMMMAVYERVPEIGTIAAIGTMPGKIRLIFLFEGFFLGAAGVIVGDIIGIVFIYMAKLMKFSVSFARIDNILLDPSIPWDQMIFIAGIVIIISVIASLEPAFRASRMEPITALGYN
jgi:putative ABC transport system permease protein